MYFLNSTTTYSDSHQPETAQQNTAVCEEQPCVQSHIHAQHANVPIQCARQGVVTVASRTAG